MKTHNTRLGFVGKVKNFAYLSSFVTIRNNTSVLVENCSRICECSDIMVKVSTDEYYIEIWGNMLDVSQFSQDCVDISGVIDSVKLISKNFRERKQDI